MSFRSYSVLVMVIFGSILISSESSDSLTLGELISKSTPSTAFITADATDNNTGAPQPQMGSGVVVSDDGYVLTAYHVLKAWIGQTSAEKLKNKIWVRLGSRYAEALEAQIVGFATDEPDGVGDDIAIIQILRPGIYKKADICFARRKNAGEKIIAFGFPGGDEFNHAEGAISNSSGPGGRWTANINVDFGMSGGPVYDSAMARVVGIVKGGKKDIAPVRYITQIIRARTKLQDHGIAAEMCPDGPKILSGPTAATTAESIPASCREIAFTDYSQVPPQFSKRIICDKETP